MSSLHEIITIEPPVGISHKGARTEIFTSKIYKCSVCNGEGGKWVDSRSIDYNSVIGDYFEICTMCDGTGNIQAQITQKWVSAGEVKEQYKM